MLNFTGLGPRQTTRCRVNRILANVKVRTFRPLHHLPDPALDLSGGLGNPEPYKLKHRQDVVALYSVDWPVSDEWKNIALLRTDPMFDMNAGLPPSGLQMLINYSGNFLIGRNLFVCVPFRPWVAAFLCDLSQFPRFLSRFCQRNP